MAARNPSPLEAGNTGVDEDSPLRRPHVFPQKAKTPDGSFQRPSGAV